MKYVTPVIALGSCAAGFWLAALTLRNSPSSVEDKPAEKAAAPAAPAHSDSVSAGVLEEIAAAMALAPTEETARAWASRNPNAFHRWLLTAQPLPAMNIGEAFFIAWMEHDPRTAFVAACNMPERYRMGDSLKFGMAYGALFGKNPSLALEFLPLAEAGVSNLPTDYNYFAKPPDTALATLRPAEVAVALNSARGTSFSEELTRAYAGFLSRQSTEDAVAWAGTLAPGHAWKAYETILGQAAQKSPQAAFELMSRLPPEQRQLVMDRPSSVIKELARNAPGETIAWLSEQVGLVPRGAEKTLVYAWLDKDRAAATDWLLTAGHPEDRERRITGASAAAGEKLGAAKALTWAENLPPEIRGTALTGIVANPAMKDISAVLKYLAPRGDGSLTPSQIQVMEALGTRVKDLAPSQLAEVQEWSRSPANVSGRTFER